MQSFYQVFSPTGEYLCAFGEEGATGKAKLSFPSGVEIDAHGHVYIADATQRVQIWQLQRVGGVVGLAFIAHVITRIAYANAAHTHMQRRLVEG